MGCSKKMLILQIVLVMIGLYAIAIYFRFRFHKCKFRTVYSGRTHLFSHCTICKKYLSRDKKLDMSRHQKDQSDRRMCKR